MGEWISTKDRLPEDDQTVLCYQPGRTAALPVIAFYDKDCSAFCVMFSWQEILIQPTHWMPLPQPPPKDPQP